MARPQKAVVDCFPHYVNHGRTMFTIESKYGNDGYAFWFKLLELLGTSEHHYIDCNNIESWEFLIAKTRMSEETVVDIIELLSKLGAIDKELWQCKIIRSDNFITNLSTVYKRREVKVLNNSEVMSLCIQKPPLSEVIVDINPQSKVKESKGEKSIKDYSLEFEKFRQRYDPETLEKIDSYFEILRTTRVSGKISDSITFQVYDEMNKHPPVIVKYACSTVVKKPELHSKKENYFYGIMRNTTADEADNKLNGIQTSKYVDRTNYKPGE